MHSPCHPAHKQHLEAQSPGERAHSIHSHQLLGKQGWSGQKPMASQETSLGLRCHDTL